MSFMTSSESLTSRSVITSCLTVEYSASRIASLRASDRELPVALTVTSCNDCPPQVFVSCFKTSPSAPCTAEKTNRRAPAIRIDAKRLSASQPQANVSAPEPILFSNMFAQTRLCVTKPSRHISPCQQLLAGLVHSNSFSPRLFQNLGFPIMMYQDSLLPYK